MKFTHDSIERSVGLLIILTVLVVSIGGLVEIVPLFFQTSTTTPVEGLKPYDPVRLTGRDIYIREGCFLCHSQMIRPFRAETERYGPYSVAGEFVYDHPFQWGSKRTGRTCTALAVDIPTSGIAFAGNPRDLVPDSNMPAFAWLAKNPADAAGVAAKMRALRKVGVPYTDEEIAGASKQLEGKSEMDALIAYLQGMGLERKGAK